MIYRQTYLQGKKNLLASAILACCLLSAVSSTWADELIPLRYTAHPVSLANALPTATRSALQISPYKKLASLEQTLYEQVYQQQGVIKRLERLERSVYGKRQQGSVYDRLISLDQTLSQTAQAKEDNAKERDLLYIEKRLLGQTHPHESLDSRITRLEKTTIGQTQDSLPTEQRLRELGQLVTIDPTAVQLNIKPLKASPSLQTQQRFVTSRQPTLEHTAAHTTTSVSHQTLATSSQSSRGLSKQATPLRFKAPKTFRQAKLIEAVSVHSHTAETALIPEQQPRHANLRAAAYGIHPSHGIFRNGAGIQLTLHDKAKELPVRLLPHLDTGDDNKAHYVASIFGYSPGRTHLRWAETRVKVYAGPVSPEQQILITEGFRFWKSIFQWQQVFHASEADILLSFANTASLPLGEAHWLGEAEPVLTQPRQLWLRQGDTRTVVTITLPEQLLRLKPRQQPRAIAHQIGHALGLWGHSSDPTDVMYPHYGWERSDIPSGFKAPVRSLVHQVRRPFQFLSASASTKQQHKASKRDITTLRRLYRSEGQSIALYEPTSDVSY